jgi:hypothetical protein
MTYHLDCLGHHLSPRAGGFFEFSLRLPDALLVLNHGGLVDGALLRGAQAHGEHVGGREHRDKGRSGRAHPEKLGLCQHHFFLSSMCWPALTMR